MVAVTLGTPLTDITDGNTVKSCASSVINQMFDEALM